MIVQIYEIQDPKEAEGCIEAGVDHVGSVLLGMAQWKQPLIRDVVRLSSGTGVKNSIIPLFRDPDTLYRALDYYCPHFVHFCENLTDGKAALEGLEEWVRYQGEVRRRFPETGIIRTIPIPLQGEMEDFPFMDIAAAFSEVSDIYLTDTWVGEAPVEGYVGITGKTCDRAMAARLASESSIPVILAGGLNPENVLEAALEIAPAGVDSCTGTNSTDGEGMPVRFRKDFEEVGKFVGKAREAEVLLGARLDELEAELRELRAELSEKEKAIPPHSVKPHQLLAIEELEDQIGPRELELERLKLAVGTNGKE